MRPKRNLKFNPPAQQSRNDFRAQYGENARVCLDWLEQETRLAPETGELIGNHRFTLAVEVGAKIGTFRCRAVYIFNDTDVKWLLFSHEFIPAK